MHRCPLPFFNFRQISPRTPSPTVKKVKMSWVGTHPEGPARTGGDGWTEGAEGPKGEDENSGRSEVGR